jgi:CDP-glucose 4,6-dehydratase
LDNYRLISKSDLRIFKGKTVLITGHTGFKGSWLSLILHDAGANVVGLSLEPNRLSHFNLLGLENLVTHNVGDIRNLPTVMKVFDDYKPQYVFHLAAQAIVRESYISPIETLETNVLGSANILEAIRQTQSVQNLVYITSDKCYQNNEWSWGYREIDQLGGNDLYSASKAAAEVILTSYKKSFFQNRKSLAISSARAGNVIGGGDWSLDRIIPDCIRAAFTDRDVIIRNPNSTRPWQHVLEPISGYITLAIAMENRPLDISGAWNFGPMPKESRSVIEIAKMLYGHLGKGKIRVEIDLESSPEAGLLQLNCDKANRELGWYPRWSVEKAIGSTARWYLAHEAGANTIDITREQINEYFGE